jgi:hypothetical protein
MRLKLVEERFHILKFGGASLGSFLLENMAPCLPCRNLEAGMKETWD